MSTIRADLTGEFGVPSSGAGLKLELDNRLGLAPPGGYRIRVYPPLPVKLSASTYPVAQPVLTTEQRVHKIANEAVELSGQDRVRTDYPITALRSVVIPQTLFAFDTDGTFKPVQFSASSVTVDPDTRELILPQPCWGMLIVGYDANYRIATWVPPRTYNGYYGGVTVEEGTVQAVYGPKVASLKIQIRRASANETAVLCEAISYIVISNRLKLDRYEMPPGYPDDTSYPGFPASVEPDAGSSALIDRVHATWVYDAFGAVWPRMPMLPPTIYKPYAGSSTYHPQVGVRFARQPYTDSMADAFARAISEKSYIIERLQAQFPNWIGEIS